MSTPMLKQYFTMKEQAPGALLLFRCGDFYETYGEDAEIAARALEIVCTARDAGGGQKIAMAGVPYHAVDGYLRTLIAKGFKVALCEQMEDPKLAKGLVKRDIVRVVTSGTVLDPDMLEAGRHNFLMAVSAGPAGIGIAVADASTGEFSATQVAAGQEARAAEEIQRWRPAEILFAEDVDGESAVRRMADRLAIPSAPWSDALPAGRAAEALQRHFAVANLSAYGLAKWPEATRAAAAVLRYLADTQRSDCKTLTAIRTYQVGDFLVIDPTTARNLELTQTMLGGHRKGSVLGVMDHTITPMGARLIRQWLERPLVNREAIAARHDGVEALVLAYDAAEGIRKHLRGVGDLERLVAKVLYETATARDLLALAASLKAVGPPKDAAARVGGALAGLADRLDPLTDVSEFLDHAVHPDPPLLLREGQLIKDGYHQEVDELRRIRSDAKGLIARLEEAERKRTGIKSLKIGYNNVFGYYIEVTKPNLAQVPPDFIRKQTVANGERFISQPLKEAEATIAGAQERLVALEYDLFVEIRARVAARAAAIQATARAVAELDTLAGLAHLAVTRQYVRPALIEEDRITITGGRHPVVEQAVKDGFVPNDLHLDGATERLLLVTGPNMAGKSTYLRQAALIVIMAQAGSFVPAASAELGLADRVFTRVGASDDLHLGQSTFLVEMSETAHILHHATPRSLVILDEIGRGTSTYDGLALAWAVAEYLHDTVQAKTLFATHYHELTQLGELLPAAKNYRVAVKETADGIIFLHRIVPGGADKSYGIYVAKLAGLPNAVLERAHGILGFLEQEETALRRSQRAALGEPPDTLQLTMFETSPHPVLEELAGLPLAKMTPLEALTTLHQWQAVLHNGKDFTKAPEKEAVDG